jgi:hypothetical protein
MMTATLFCLPRGDELLHSLEDFIHPSQLLVEEVLTVELQEPVVSLILIYAPMASLDTLPQGFGIVSSPFVLFFRSWGFQNILGSGLGRFAGSLTKWVDIFLKREAGENFVI